MKHLVLAAAAVLAVGTGAALADGNVPAQPAGTRSPATAQWTQSPSGIYTADTPHHQVWVYGAMRGTGYAQGGQQ